MTSAKKDSVRFEENLNGDLKCYERAVAAMKYYGARVNSGIACGDSRVRHKSPEMIRGILPPTLPVACKMLPGQSTCYYHMISDEHMEVPKYEMHLTSETAPDCIPSTSSAAERPAIVPTKISFSSNNQPVRVVDKVRCILSTSPTRTKIPVAQASRSNMKSVNGAYFAPSPPVKPIPIKVYPPSMFARKDITHNCIHRPKQEDIKMCERVIAEAINNGKNPNEINIPQAFLKLVPPRKLVESMKERTFTMQCRLDERLSSPQRTNEASIEPALNSQEQEREPQPDNINYAEAESNCKEESDCTEESVYSEEQISLIETPSNLIEMSNDSCSEVGCVNTTNKTSEVTIQGDLHSDRSEETIKNSNENVKTNGDLPIQLLAEALLADIVQKFPSQEELCADLKINNTQYAKFPSKLEPTNNILNDLNNVLQQHLNEDSGPAANVLSTDTEESCLKDCKNESMCAEKEEELAAKVREIAERMVQLEPANRKSNMWRGSPESVREWSGYAHSTSTGLGFIAHDVLTAGTSTTSSSSSKIRQWIRAVECRKNWGYIGEAYVQQWTTSRCDDDVKLSVCATEKKFIQRTVSTYTSRTCCDCEKELKNVRPTSSHKSIQVSIPNQPISERALHMLLNKRSFIKKHCTPSSCVYEFDRCGIQETPVMRCKSTVSSRLMTDLKKSQQILGLVDAALKHEDETTSSDCMGDAMRLKSRMMTKNHRSRISTSSSNRFAASDCVQHLQLLRNEHIQHIQGQFKIIISLNNFIDKFQSMH